jgi:hypothetical protein
MTPHLSDLALDRLRTGEALSVETRAHLESCGQCAARKAELDEDAAAFARAAPIAELAAATRRRLGSHAWQARRRRVVYGAMAMLSAAAVLLLMWRAPEPELRAKGGVALDLFRKRATGEVEALLPLGRVLPGDALRFRLGTPQAGYATIISIDGAGVVSTYYPDAPELAPIARGRNQLLDAAIELDGTLGKERLIVFVCRQRLSTRAVRDAVAAELVRVAGDAGRVEPARAQPDCAATSFAFEKVPPR